MYNWTLFSSGFYIYVDSRGLALQCSSLLFVISESTHLDAMRYVYSMDSFHTKSTSFNSGKFWC